MATSCRHSWHHLWTSFWWQPTRTSFTSSESSPTKCPMQSRTSYPQSNICTCICWKITTILGLFILTLMHGCILLCLCLTIYLLLWFWARIRSPKIASCRIPLFWLTKLMEKWEMGPLTTIFPKKEKIGNKIAWISRKLTRLQQASISHKLIWGRRTRW